MSKFRTFRYYGTIVATIIGVLAVGGLSLKHACFEPPDAAVTFGVSSDGNYDTPTESAMNIMNGFVGCKFLVPGDDGKIMSATGEPCGKAFHPAIPKEHHSAQAFKCDPNSPTYAGNRWEAHISMPGDIRTQVCIIAHEIGHMVGLEDKPASYRGIMNQKVCPETQIILSDDEVETLRDKFCK